MDLKRCFKIIEDFGFNVDMESKYIQQHTPLGEDWNINFDECENAKELIECLENCLDGVDDDTTTFVDMRGTHGIPDDLQAIVEDGEWKKQVLKDMIMKVSVITSEFQSRSKDSNAETDETKVATKLVENAKNEYIEENNDDPFNDEKNWVTEW